MNTKKKYITVIVAVVVTIVIAALYDAEKPVEQGMGSTSGFKVDRDALGTNATLAMVVWSDEDVENFVYEEKMAKTKYGTIVKANAPTNEYHITTMYVYLPDIPFPTNKVHDEVLLICDNSAQENNPITNLFIFALEPEYKSLRVVTVQIENHNYKSFEESM